MFILLCKLLFIPAFCSRASLGSEAVLRKTGNFPLSASPLISCLSFPVPLCFLVREEGTGSFLVLPLWNRFKKRKGQRWKSLHPDAAKAFLIPSRACHTLPCILRTQTTSGPGSCSVWFEKNSVKASQCAEGKPGVDTNKCGDWRVTGEWGCPLLGRMHVVSVHLCVSVSAAVWLGDCASRACVKALGVFSAPVSKTIPRLFQWIQQLQQQLWNAL